MFLIVGIMVVGLIAFFIFKNLDRRTPEQKYAEYTAWEDAARGGDESAPYKLLMLYHQEKDPSFWPMAFEWTLFVAQKGEDAGVMLQAGDMYMSGHGTDKNEAEALKWYERALSINIALGPQGILDKDTQHELERTVFELREKYPPQI